MPTQSRTSPPYLAEWLLRQMIDEQDRDAIIGDFAEEYNKVSHEHTQAKAKWFYWTQVLKSCLPLMRLKLTRQVERSLTMLENKRIFWISLAALLPASLLVTIGILQSGFGITAPNDAIDALFQKYTMLKFIYHPIIILGGLGAAVILNLLPVSKFQWDSQTQSISATATLKNNLAHWILLGVGMFLLAALLAYGIVENFSIIPR